MEPSQPKDNLPDLTKEKPLQNCKEELSPKLTGFEFWRSTLKSARYVVAPMVDQSELAWRLLSRRYGAELCYTPMYHAPIFARDPSYRKEALASCTEDRPLIVQFCANDPELLLKAAKLAEPHCDAVDLNLGCPQSIAKRGHYGVFLQDEWDLVYKMINLCHKNLQVPITCKIRVFESIDKTVQYAQMLERAGCQLLTVHGRTKDQKGRFTGMADWKYIKAVRENVNIPVFANGNIQSVADVKACLHETGANGVMTAEGNLHNPALFCGHHPPVWQVAEEYLSLVEQYPCSISYSRGHLFKLFHHALQKHIDVRAEIGQAKSFECLRLATLHLKEKSLDDMNHYHDNPDNSVSGQLYPYWLCQPYFRPSPEEPADESKKCQRPKRDNDSIRRHLAILGHPLKDDEVYSRNKLKKRLRNPYKNYDPDKKDIYEKCSTCDNSKGHFCSLAMCKVCCRKKASTEMLDCNGHRFLYHTRHIKHIQYEEKRRQMDAMVVQDNGVNVDALLGQDTGVNVDTLLGQETGGSVNGSLSQDTGGGVNGSLSQDKASGVAGCGLGDIALTDTNIPISEEKLGTHDAPSLKENG